MMILDQAGENLYSLEGSYIGIDGVDKTVIRIENADMLGRYDTPRRAKEVLRNIIEYYRNYNSVEDGYRYAVYEMPPV